MRSFIVPQLKICAKCNSYILCFCQLHYHNVYRYKAPLSIKYVYQLFIDGIGSTGQLKSNHKTAICVIVKTTMKNENRKRSKQMKITKNQTSLDNIIS